MGDIDDRAPGRRQARILVACAGSFWASWAAAVAGSVVVGRNSGLILLPFAVAMGSGFLLYHTLFRVWDLGYFDRRRWQAMMKLLDPRWEWRTVRATGWPPHLVAALLLSLLALDLVLFALLVGVGPTGRRW